MVVRKRRPTIRVGRPLTSRTIRVLHRLMSAGIVIRRRPCKGRYADIHGNAARMINSVRRSRCGFQPVEMWYDELRDTFRCDDDSIAELILLAQHSKQGYEEANEIITHLFSLV